MSRTARILVVGAGPTGLALTLMAHDHGAQVRIVERRPEMFRPSRALIVHPRTLEVLRPLGVVEPLLDRADVAPAVHLHIGSRVVPARLTRLALPDTAFPHLTLVRQMDVETVLSHALADRGIKVERGTELVDLCDGVDGAHATLRSHDRIETVDCDFVAGCDGPRSIVRRTAGIRWRGRPYGEEVVLADIELDAGLDEGVAHAMVGRRGLLFVFALGERATWRLLATRPARQDNLSYGQPGPPLTRAELQGLVNDSGLDAEISDLAWSARYPLQHRLAARFRTGRLFLAGDAAHAWSPAGGHGMNTGIQDAVNLGWKLAFAPAAGDPGALLGSYERERRPVARQMLALTHAAFWAEASTSVLPSLVRGVVAPLGVPAMPAVLRRRRLVSRAIRMVSRLDVAYRRSPLSVEGRPRLPAGPRPGERLPDAMVTAGGQPVRLHALLAHPGVHVLLHRDAAPIERLTFGPHVRSHRLTSVPGAGMVAVRPDGYAGFRCGTADVVQLRAWLARIGAGDPAEAGDSAR
jgi:2-polyprenyl-6-methoxyphenol hydroxylase-like FAD-dependent oxidoreductase